MCNFKQCLYAITDHIDEGDNRHEIMLFCSFHDCLPENCPSDCSPNVPDDDEDFCPDCGAMIYPHNDCKCNLTYRPPF